MIKLVSINIERDLHLDVVKDFLLREMPDVVCVQELFEKDIKFFEEFLGFKSCFMPMAYHRSPRESTEGEELYSMGIAIFAKNLSNTTCDYISDQRINGDLPNWHNNFSEEVRDIVSTVLVGATVTVGDNEYNILTTHFTRTPNGDTTPYQMDDIRVLMDMLNKKTEFILCGDFNAPRQFKAFQTIAGKYKDNIPEIYTTSIDSSIHRLNLPDRMVDGLFTTGGYVCSNVRLQDGISDHMAIVANVDIV